MAASSLHTGQLTRLLIGAKSSEGSAGHQDAAREHAGTCTKARFTFTAAAASHMNPARKLKERVISSLLNHTELGVKARLIVHKLLSAGLFNIITS